jgi:3-keto-disaccharide hydrolase
MRKIFSKKTLFKGVPFYALSLIMLWTSFTVSAQNDHNAVSDSAALLGRWDITVDNNGNKLPSWLEVHHSGLRMLVGRFVGTGGSARPISRIYFENGKMNFSIPPQWEPEDRDLSVEGTLKDGILTGTMTLPDGKTCSWVGKKAPLLRRKTKPVWGKPIHLFDGTSQKEWHADGPNQWIVQDGLLRSPRRGSNLITNRTFRDFKLHIEFRYSKGSNSGVYLRGRYEVQIIDSKGQEPSNVLLGGVYGFLTPGEMVARAPGEWQSFDITLVGRMVTVVANGKTYDQEIPGITGGAIDCNEGDPGPICLQGSEDGQIDFRNIIITPAD